MYSICNITSFDTFSYYQIIIYMQSINPYPVYTRISIAFLLQMYTSSLSLPPQLLLRCNYDAPGPRGHLGKSNWRFIVVQSHLTVQCFEKMCKLSHNQEPFASRYVTQVSWFLIQNNSALYTQIWLKPSARVVQQPASPWATHNGVGLQAREEWGENNHPVFSKLHPRAHHTLLINLRRTRKPIHTR